MLLSLQWLREFTPFDKAPQELSDRLTMLGLEVEEWRKPFDHLATVVVGHVETCAKHPEADKLSLCRVNVSNESLPIVCGAPNVAQGQKVAVAKIGTVLPGGLTIKKAKIRGEESCGMICSEIELGLGEDKEGIMVLSADAPVGVALTDAIKLDTDIFNVNITPNRADCLSMLGLAREVAAAYRLPLSLPANKLTLETAPLDWAIHIPEGELCPLYQGRIIENVTVAKSPAWLRYRLLAMGQRPINNLVDVTNYVMLEMGQPLHAFDRDLLKGKTIRVERAADGMVFTTLDNQERKLTSQDILIWDADRPVALAGVMGGANTEISSTSRNVFLEGAVFRPASIRKTARRLALPSEAAYRMERGLDQLNTPLALERATALIAELGGGQIAPGVMRGEPKPYKSRILSFRPEKARRFLSLPVDPAFCKETLQALGCQVTATEDEPWSVVPPSFRHDLEREVDLTEEVGRVYGLDRIPSELPKLTRSLETPVEEDRAFAFHHRIKSWAKGLGLTEVINYSFVGTKDLDICGQANPGRVCIFNPLSEEQNVLRTALTPGLLANVRTNLGHGAKSLRLFEVAKVFVKDAACETCTQEKNRLALLLSGRRHPEAWPWPGDEADYQDIKGLVTLLFRSLRLPAPEFRAVSDHPFLLPAVACLTQDQEIGVLGRVNPEIATEFNSQKDIWLAEMELDDLMTQSAAVRLAFKELPKFPPVRRDMTVIAPQTMHYEVIAKAIQDLRPNILEDVQLVDLYHPEGAAEHNLTFRFTYRHPAKTLKDEEVDKLHAKVVDSLPGILPIRFS